MRQIMILELSIGPSMLRHYGRTHTTNTNRGVVRKGLDFPIPWYHRAFGQARFLLRKHGI